jgi:hypothetical protein
VKTLVILFLVLSHNALVIAQLVIPADAAVATSGREGKVSIGTCEEPDFFVIDTSPCPQTPVNCAPDCPGIISRFLPDQRFHPSNRDELLSTLQPGVPVCVLVHGSFVSAGDVYPESVERYKRIVSSAGNRPIHLIAMHWPSRPSLLLLPAVQVSALGRRAEFNGIYLAQFISQLPPDQPVSLIGHSHGSRVVAAAMHLLGGGQIRGFTVADPNPTRRIRVVLGAAAIDHHWLNPGDRYGCALPRVESLLNIKNNTDFVLNMYVYSKLNLTRALGQAGFHRHDVRRMGVYANRVREYDATMLVGPGHMIASYAPHPQIRTAYLPYLYFD